MAKTDLTAARLRDVLSYDPETGIFRWLKPARTSRAKPGKVAGHISVLGYLIIKLDQVVYPAHRLAWLYMTGSHPTHEIDHIDHVRANNAFANLREATRKQNQENKTVKRDSKSGVNGVTWDRQRGKWFARIKHRGVITNLGRYTELADAIAARQAAERKHFTHSPWALPLQA